MSDTSKEEMDNCTGQCGYLPICRQCELEKKRKCMEAVLRKKKNEENADFGPQP